MRSFLKTREFLVIATLIVFLVPIVVGLPIAFFGTYLPLAVSLPLILLGMLAAAGLAIRTQLGLQAELEQEIARISQALNQKTRELFEAQIRIILHDAVDDLSVPPKARAFLYLMDQSTNRLVVTYNANMEGSPDHKLSFQPLHGWAGVAWGDLEQFHYDVRKFNKNYLKSKWRFSEGEVKVIRRTGIQSVLYTPVIHPNNADIVIGVLGVDSSRPLSETKFDMLDKQNVANKIATVLGGLLVDGNIVD